MRLNFCSEGHPLSHPLLIIYLFTVPISGCFKIKTTFHRKPVPDSKEAFGHHLVVLRMATPFQISKNKSL